MPLPKGFREWLAKESAAWTSEGLIDGPQRDRLLARYPEEATDSSALAFALRTLAVLLFGAAIFLVISHNWADLSRNGQLAIVFAALAAIQGAGLYFFLKGQERSATIGHLLGCLMFGGGIALIGQIYHLDAHAPDAILAWCVFTIPFALLLDATVLHLLVIVLAGIWLSMETVGENVRYAEVSPLFLGERLTFLLLLVPTAIAAYRRSRPALAGALAWAILFVWFAFVHGHVPAHLFVLPLALAAFHPTGDARGRGFRFIGTFGVAFLTLALGSLWGPDGLRHNRFAEYFLRHDWLLSAATVALAIGAIVRARRRQDTHAGWLGLVALLGVSLSLIGSFGLGHFRQRDGLWVLIAAMANVTTLLLAVTLIRQGLAEQRLRPYVYGASVFLAWLTWRYIDIEKDLGYLGMAGVFACIGAILFTLAMIWRQPREAEIAEAMDDFRPAWLESALEKLAPHRRSLIAGALAFQFGVLGWMVYDHQRPISSGERFLLRCEPVDPRSLTKGDYVVLSYEFQRITNIQKNRLMEEWLQANATPPHGSKPSFDYAMPADVVIYIPLHRGRDGIAEYGEPTIAKPASGAFLQTRKGHSHWTWQATDVRAGIESYYVAEGTGHKWEELRNRGQLLAEVGVLPNGKAGLISLKASDTATIRTLRHSTLDRYFVTLKDTTPVTKAIRSKEEFSANFHPAPLNGLSAIAPNFPRDLVLLHTLPETDVATTITFKDVGVRDGVLTAKVTVTRGTKQTYTIRPQAAIVVPSAGITAVEITSEDGQVKLLDVKLR